MRRLLPFLLLALCGCEARQNCSQVDLRQFTPTQIKALADGCGKPQPAAPLDSVTQRVQEASKGLGIAPAQLVQTDVGRQIVWSDMEARLATKALAAICILITWLSVFWIAYIVMRVPARADFVPFLKVFRRMKVREWHPPREGDVWVVAAAFISAVVLSLLLYFSA